MDTFEIVPQEEFLSSFDFMAPEPDLEHNVWNGYRFVTEEEYLDELYAASAEW